MLGACAVGIHGCKSAIIKEWPFDDGVARPIERLRFGGLDEVLSAAAGFGATFT